MDKDKTLRVAKGVAKWFVQTWAEIEKNQKKKQDRLYRRAQRIRSSEVSTDQLIADYVRYNDDAMATVLVERGVTRSEVESARNTFKYRKSKASK